MSKKNVHTGPQFVSYFPSVLQALQELGGSARPAEVRDRVAVLLEITSSEQEELLSSGQPRFDNHVAWARFYLAKSGYIDSSERGVWTLTEKGRNANLDQKASLDIFRATHSSFLNNNDVKTSGNEEALAPEDDVAPILNAHRETLLAILQNLPANGFERFCQRLLRESGFQDVTVTGRPNDGGIDGIGVLQINPFVSFKVLFQCKKYQRSVVPSQIRDFRGAMQGRTDKGIIITTGSFTSEAKKEALRDGVPPIELVDGEKLIEMLEGLELGLTPVRAFRIDDRFFDDYRN